MRKTIFNLMITSLLTGCAFHENLQAEYQLCRLVKWQWTIRYDNNEQRTKRHIRQTCQFQDGILCDVDVKYPVPADTTLGTAKQMLVRK